MTGTAVRDYRILRYVNAFCPRCHEEEPFKPLAEVPRLSGYLAEAEGQVWLVRGCSVHGRVVTLYDEDPEILAYLEQWTAPTKEHTPDTVGNYEPVPAAYLQGLGEMQTQHTCILLEDITESCNLRCPTCFADSAPNLVGMASVEDVLANVDQRIARENGRLDVVMVSGGEPTVHPDFLRILDGLQEREIVRIIVNTNGVDLSRDDEILDYLRGHRDRCEIYLQFDGFRKETYLHHRKADLRSMKQRTVERLSQAGVFTTLTMTAALGVNDDEIGDVVLYSLDIPYVSGVSIQPVFGSGRSQPINPLERLTHTGVLARLGPQTEGRVTYRDLIGLPCSHPHCCSIGYLIRGDTGEWASLVGLIGHERLKDHLDLVSNHIADVELPRELRVTVKEALLGLMSEQQSLSHSTVGELLADVCRSCDLGLASILKAVAAPGRHHALRRLLGERIKRITVKPFMDINTMIEERLLQCCVHVGTKSAEQNQCAPFCAAQAWRAIGAQKISTETAHPAQVPIELTRPEEARV